LEQIHLSPNRIRVSPRLQISSPKKIRIRLHLQKILPICVCRLVRSQSTHLWYRSKCPCVDQMTFC